MERKSLTGNKGSAKNEQVSYILSKKKETIVMIKEAKRKRQLKNKS